MSLLENRSVAQQFLAEEGQPLDGIILTVRGDCGKIHSSFEEWQKCQVCESVLVRRLRDGRFQPSPL